MNSGLLQQFWRLGNVGGDAPGLVAGEQMSRANAVIEAWSVPPRSCAVVLPRLAPSLLQGR